MKILIAGAVALLLLGGFFAMRHAERTGESTPPLGTTEPTPTLTPPTPILKKENVDAAFTYSRTHTGAAVLVMRDGAVVYEDYENGFKKGDPHQLASGTKTFSGVALAAMIQDGLVSSYDAKVSDVVTEWKHDAASPAKANTTLRQLLSLSSGLNPGENGSAPTYEKALVAPLSSADIGTFQYGPTPFQVWGAYASRLLISKGYADFADYLQKRVLTPAGITLYRWGTVAPHEQNLAGGVAITAENWAAFGELLRNGGSANGKQIIRSDLLATLHQPSANYAGYGITMWLTTDTANGMATKGLADSEKTISGHGYVAAGAGNERLFVLPDYGMTVVRFGEADNTWNDAAFLKALLGT